MNPIVFVLVGVLGTQVDAGLDLSEVGLMINRLGRQFGGTGVGKEEEGGGGVALGLVSALQKWANSLESQTSTLRSEMLGLKNSNVQLMEEMQQVKGHNINLKNDVSNANERSINLKNNVQKMSKIIQEMTGENKALKTLVQQQNQLVNSHQGEIEKYKDDINSLKTKVSSTTTSLNTLQGKTDSFSVTVTDKLVKIQPKLDNLYVSLHDLSENCSNFHLDTSGQLSLLAKQVVQHHTNHTQTTDKLKADLARADREGMESMKGLANNIETKLREDINKWERISLNLKSQTLSAVSTLNVEVDSLANKIDGNTDELSSLKSFQSEAQTNLKEIKTEINKSVQFLTRQLNQNFTRVEGGLITVKRDLGTLEDQSAKVVGEMNKLRSHTQRSVDTSSGMLLKISRLEGKLSELNKKGSQAEEQMKALDKQMKEDKEMHMNTVNGIQRMDESISSLKGEMTDSNLKGALEILKSNTQTLAEDVEKLSLKQNQDRQDLTRNTGRINKVDLDMRGFQEELGVVEQGLDEMADRMDREVGNVAKVAGSVKSEMNKLEKKVTSLGTEMNSLGTEVNSLGTLVTTTRNAVADLMTKTASLEAQDNGASPDNSAVVSTVDTLKTNVIGLGNYINSINREVNSLARRTRESVDNLNRQVGDLTSGLEDIKNDGTKRSSSGDLGEVLVSSSLKTEVAGLSSKLYNIKTELLEMSTGLEGVRAGLQQLDTKVKKVDQDVKDVNEKVVGAEISGKSNKEGLASLRSGMSGLTSSVLAVRGQLKVVSDLETRLGDLTTNLTGEVGSLRPKVDLVTSDMVSLSKGVTRLSGLMKSAGDPPRFSCGVTGDELKVSGVISYDECTVNKDKMMNLGTGHATVPVAGDYVLSFTANMVSSNSQAIWCALYKQSPGDEGWQVLGMINNYQRDAGDEDDRDSGSLSIIAELKEGDQVWVEWRGYGDSFLYSNPYKLISFTGYLLTSPVLE